MGLFETLSDIRFLEGGAAHDAKMGVLREVEALQSELADLRALAGELAKMVPDYFHGNSDIWCVFCDAQLNVESPSHAPDCLWLRAQRWKR
jgi:hypothetical protein